MLRYAFQVRNGMLCMYVQALDWKACAKRMQLPEGVDEALKRLFHTLCHNEGQTHKSKL